MIKFENSKPAAPEGDPGWHPKLVPFPKPSPAAPLPPGKPGDEHRQIERQYAALLSAVADLVFLVRRGGEIIEFHGPKDNEFMLTSEAVVGRRLMALLPSQAGQMATHYVEKTLRTGLPQVFSYHYVLPGRLRIFEARTAVCGPDLVLAVVRDTTDRNLLEKEVVESSNRLQLRIGQDLHDGLGQHLAGITFLTKALERKLEASNLPAAAEVAEITRLVMEALSQTRNLARGMFPAEVESRGLLVGLRELAHNFEERCHISCELEGEEEPTFQDPAAAMHLFRVAQEAVTNAVTHGKAHRVTIRLVAEADNWVLSVTDDGVGIPAERQRCQGLGLRIMSYRAQRLGGTLQVEPSPCGGTSVICTFPGCLTEI